MDDSSFASLVLFGLGALLILSAALNLDWVFKSRRAWIFVRLFGRGGARIFYGLLGAGLGVYALYLAFPIELQAGVVETFRGLGNLLSRQTIQVFLFILTGLVFIFGAYYESDWFFEESFVQFLIRNLGRRGAKVVYFLLGFGLYGLGAWLISMGDRAAMIVFAGILAALLIGMVVLRKPVARMKARRAAAKRAVQVDKVLPQEVSAEPEMQLAVDSSLETVPLVPFSPKNLLFLFFRPVRFFTPAMARYPLQYAYIAILLYGMVKTSERLGDLYLLFRRDMIGSNLQATIVSISSNWIYYWAIVIAWGIILAFAYWYVGGWWFQLRIKWSGDPDPDGNEARQVYAYSTLVYALPIMAYTLYQTAVFQGYGHAFASESLFTPILLIIFPFFSLYVAWWAVRTRFEVHSSRSMWWFIFLPSVVYILGICWALPTEF